jgi:zinc transport system substrate-binding protein
MKDVSLICVLMFSVALVSVLNGCSNREIENKQSEIAVTNSYLQCVVKDLCGDDTEVLCLAPPGMCPGHFDISPTQVKQLCDCRILLLFDFQQKIEDSLSRMRKNGLKTAFLEPLPGLCVPETYVTACRQVANILSAEYPERQSQYERRLRLIEKRMKQLGLELRTVIEQSGVKAAEVVASDYQAEFAGWLGLETIATFKGSDIETASNINQCLTKAQSQDVKYVIANKQEGTALADALAERLHAKAVVFSNFSDVNADSNGFDRLLRNNVQSLVEAAGQ